MNIDGAIVILGSRNDEKGNLIPNARARVEKSIEVFHKFKNFKLLPTGGYGSHFNTTDKPHGLYTRRYLLSRGIADSDVLPVAESKNTIEDAKLSKPIIDSLGIKNIILVTSNYHALRARIIFKRVYGKGYNIRVIGAPNTYSLKTKMRMYYHEIRQTIKILLGFIKI